MKIRRMSLRDYNKVYDIWISTKGMGLNNIDDSRKGIKRFIKRNKKTSLVLTYNKEIIGVILIGNDGRRGYIYHLSILEKFRNNGYGRMLVQKGLLELKKLHISKVALLVFENNANANMFWEHLGFTKRDDILYRNISLVDIKRIDT